MEGNTSTTKLINIREVIGKKNPALLKLLPRCMLNYIIRILHQDEINDVVSKYSTYYGLDFLDRCLSYMGFHYKVEGEEHIPSSGRFIVAGNHPLGGLDGMMLMSAIGKHHKNIKFIVNDILLNLKNLASLFIPVNKHGGQPLEYARMIEEAYSSDAQILYFPAGLCSRKINGKIMDLEWKKSFIEKAIKHKRDIIPVFIEGKNSNFFYNLANIRKWLGIKANIEMFYLADEMFNQKTKNIVLKFGKPIAWQTFDTRFNKKIWAAKVKEHVYALQQDINKDFTV